MKFRKYHREMKSALICIVAALSLLCFTGCIFEFECEQPATGVVEVKYEWGNDYTPSVEGMAIYFFATDENGRNWRFDIAGDKGGRVELPFGSYEMLTFNNDVRYLHFANTEAASTFTAVLNSSNNKVRPVSPLYCDYVSDVDFCRKALSYFNSSIAKLVEISDERPVLVSHPYKITTTYHLEVMDIPEIEKVTAASFSIHGISELLCLYDGHLSGRKMTLSDQLVIDKDKKTFCVEFESFACDTADGDILLDISYRTSDREWSKTFNITRQVAENLNPRKYVNILINGKDFPVSGASGGDVGSIVDLDGWTEIIVDYEHEI